MAMKKGKDKPLYRTRDLAEAAFVAVELGLPQIEETLTNSPVYFSWKNSERAVELSTQYWSGGLVAGLKFAQMQRSIKDLIFGRGEPLRARGFRQ